MGSLREREVPGAETALIIWDPIGRSGLLWKLERALSCFVWRTKPNTTSSFGNHKLYYSDSHLMTPSSSTTIIMHNPHGYTRRDGSIGNSIQHTPNFLEDTITHLPETPSSERHRLRSSGTPHDTSHQSYANGTLQTNTNTFTGQDRAMDQREFRLQEISCRLLGASVRNGHQRIYVGPPVRVL